MAEPTLKKTRKPRRNYEKELREIEMYCKMRLEIFSELGGPPLITAQAVAGVATFEGVKLPAPDRFIQGQISELQAILKKMEGK